VGVVKQSVEAFSLPAGEQLNPGAEGFASRFDRPVRDAVQGAAFQATDSCSSIHG